MIRKAENEDISKIMNIIKLTIEEMKTYNNTQWSENYPKDVDFLKDIEEGSLYVDVLEEELKGIICVNYEEPEEYKALNWTSDKRAMVIHRMAVNPSYRNQGVGSVLMTFAEELAIKNKINYLKTDTYSINVKMNSLFIKFGYKFIGEVRFPGREKVFNCYDKLIK